MATTDATGLIPTSGQRRINAKRASRAAYWADWKRTVRVLVSVQVEPYFRKHLEILGKGTRIDGRTPRQSMWASDLDVHIPGAPADAVRAEPVYRSEWRGDHYEPVLESVHWYNAAGGCIGATPERAW